MGEVRQASGALNSASGEKRSGARPQSPDKAKSPETTAPRPDSNEDAMSRFVSNASHELKTPLATMKVMLESLLYQPEMPRKLQEEFMRDMDHEIDRLTATVSDLLLLSKGEYTGEIRKKEKVDLSRLTEETVRMLSRVTQKRGQELTAKAAPGLCMTGDRDRLHQVLYNLIDNSVKYTPEGGHIEVALEENAGMLVWSVKDDGIGIPEKDRDYIFDRFYRVDKARSRETGGTGLGLSIVKQMVYLHGGSIAVSSEPGRGTVFTVTLPKNSGDGAIKDDTA